MIKYFFKLAFRRFEKNWLLFAASIITISTGAICISLLYTYVFNELTMNRFHKRAKDIYMMVIQISPESQPDPYAQKFNYKSYPEIENLVSIAKYSKNQINVTYGESSFSPEVLIADSTFFDLFDYKLLIGNKETILLEPETAVITEDFARKLFGDKNPVGQAIKVTTRNDKVFIIKGVLEKLPSNSSITFDLILPGHSGTYDGASVNFLLANNKFNNEAFEKKIENLENSIFKNSKISLIPFRDVYFYENYSFPFQSIFTRFGDKKNVYVLFVIMLIVFAITILNFSGLLVILVNTGIKNIGLSKILGIKNRELLLQRTIEVLLLIFISFLIVTLAHIAILPWFNRFTNAFLSPSVLKIIVLNVTVIVAIFAMAMIYPAIITLKFPIVESLKGKSFSGRFMLSQKTIVTAQYTLTIACIIASLAIFKQVTFMLHKDLGFGSKNIIRAGMYNDKPFMAGSENDWVKREAENQRCLQYLQNELASIPAIEAFTQGDGPLNPPIMMMCKLMGSDKDFWSQKSLFVQPDYLKVLGIQLSEGRFFDANKDASMGNKIVINEAAKNFWGIKNIQENRIQRDKNDSTGLEIIGVVKDFNYQHLSCKPQPLIMGYFNDIRMPFLIKFREGSVQEGLQAVSKLSKEVNPGEDFSYTFLSDEVAALSQKERRLSRIYFVFTIIALLITAIGIFVIAIYDAQRRTKEIGIRKVNGARIGEIMLMLNKDFVKLVLIAFIIACPIAWYAMHKWLENFAYKTELSWWIFALAGLLALGIALLTISWQSWRAARRNPVESLRYE